MSGIKGQVLCKWSAAMLICLLLLSACSGNNQKLSSLEGKSYRGDAPSKYVMGVQMYGYYVAKFQRDADGHLQCALTCRLHDGNAGWGSPDTDTVGVRWEDRNADYACIAKGSKWGWELGLAPAGITKDSAPGTVSFTDQDMTIITLTRQ